VLVVDRRSGRQVAQLVVPGADSEPSAGIRSVHNTEVAGDRAYSSWYAEGVAAFDLSPLGDRPPGTPVFLGRFAPPPGGRELPYVDPDAPIVWGVAIQRETGLLYLSDITTGLWIVRPVGRAAVPAPSG
jgi:hypothetical protein